MDRHHQRSGAVVLEAIIGLPILIIALMAIVEFGLLSSNQAPIHAASRAGAEVASHHSSLPTSGAPPAEIVNAVNQVLAARGFTATCVRVEHTAGPAGPYVLVSGTGASSPIAPLPTDNFVCVSVCVENTELAPNLLSAFHLDLTSTFSQHTTCRALRDCP